MSPSGPPSTNPASAKGLTVSPRPTRLAVGLACALWAMLVAVCAWRYAPPMAGPLELDLELPPGEAGRSEPLIVTGRTGAADFLAVRYTDASHVVFLYDSWGSRGLTSEPVPLTPNRRLRLRIEMPSLPETGTDNYGPSGRLLVASDGLTLLDQPIHRFQARRSWIYFGSNPLGGTSCGPRLNGRVWLHGGRELRGPAGASLTFAERFTGWLVDDRWQVASLLLLGILLVRQARRLAQPGRRRVAVWRERLRRHRGFVAMVAVSTGAFAWMITDGTFDFHEEAGILTDFYDYQMTGLLQGRLDVPVQAISGEAFVVGGKYYGYFGATPALLRAPFVIFDLGFGQLSRVFMVAYFVASLVAAHLLLLDAVRRMRGPEARPASGAAVLFGLAAGVGSTLFFLGSRAYVFHEAILCGAMFALLACWCALRHLAAPESRRWIGALLCGVASLHTRPTTGLYALTLLGCVAAVLILRAWRSGERSPLRSALRRPLLLGVLCVVGQLSFNVQAYLKFGTFDGAPLKISQPYDPERLASIGGKSLHLVNIPANFYTYAMRPNFRIERGFPWIYLGSLTPGRYFPGAKIDLPDHTLALPYAMPALVALATLGCAWTALRRQPARAPVAVVWLALGPMALTLFAAIATAQRYTGDFCPFLLCAGAWGLAAVDSAGTRWRATGLALLAAATFWSTALMSAITLHYQRAMVWGVSESVRTDYAELRHRIDGFFLP